MTDYILDLIWIMLALLPVYGMMRVLLLMRRAKRLKQKPGGGSGKLTCNGFREICLCLFVIFMTALLDFVWQGEYHSPRVMVEAAKNRLATGEGINLIPFRTIRNYHRVFGVHGTQFGINIVGNILMFVPWGFGLLLLWRKNRSIWRLLFFSAMLPILIEFSQLFINRQVDVDDFILNFCGSMLGGVLFWGMTILIPDLKEAALRPVWKVVSGKKPVPKKKVSG